MRGLVEPLLHPVPEMILFITTLGNIRQVASHYNILEFE